MANRRHWSVAATVLLAAAASMPALAAPVARDLELSLDGARMVGTLLAPEPRSVVEPVLIVPGSGPTDRDGNNPLGVLAAPYRRLAEGLAEHGVASLRIDKRGVGASRAALAREEDSTLVLAAGDVRAWAALLRRTMSSRCVWLLGHSEGALIAQLAARDNGDVCGLVLVSPLGRPAGAVLRDQLRANPANQPVLDDAFAAIALLEDGRRVDVSGMHPALRALFRPSVQPHLISIFAEDPAALLRAYGGPVLVMQGTTDLQTPVEDARRLAQARAGVELVVLDGVNHVLKQAPAERAANVATYADASLPLAPGVAEPIVRFLRDNGPERR